MSGVFQSNGLVDLTNIEPVPGQWYEMVARFNAIPEDISQHPSVHPTQASVLSARCVPKPPSAPEFTDLRSLTLKLPKKPKLLEPEEQVLTAICTRKKGDDAFFESTKTCNEGRRTFCAVVKWFQACTANNGPSPGQQYELTVRFYARATPERAHIVAASVIPCSSLCAQSSNYIVTSMQPSNAGTTSVKAKFEPEEWTLKAVCAYVKGEESFFEPVPKESAKYALFQVRTVTFAEKTGCGEPIAGQAYMLRLKFATRSAKANHVPVAHVVTAKTVGNRLSAVQFRQIETAVAESKSRQSPHVPVGDTTSSMPKERRRAKYTGVVCYKDGAMCYVYSAQLGYEVPFGPLAHGPDAAIRYVYEEGRDCGQWQLEYVYAKKIS
ncbi:hypothetical protein AAVH_07173 [Aphelenchoides avenae]|nr:hypothetical protein AAVH_07173 [Aphelenchus avenae]